MAEKDYSNEVLNGRYRLAQKLATGGMGSVYVGEHKVIGKKVAIKLLHAEFAGREDIVRRFYREAQASSIIKHPNIIDIFDIGMAPWGEPYLIMEFLEGESLGDLLRREGTLNLGAACAVMEPVLKALTAARAAGVVHRDLKPENIFLVCTENGPPTVKVIDFGISKYAEKLDGMKLTQDGSVLGTPEYMSPEQARGEKDVSFPSDIYAMGVIFYEMLVGTVPHSGANYNETMICTLTEPPREPLEVNPDFPEESRPIVMRALKKRPEDRYSNSSEMLNAIRKLNWFPYRKQQLLAVLDRSVDLSMAMGDLGVQTMEGDSSEIVARVMGDMRHSSTPSRWVDTLSQTKQVEMRRPRQWRLPLLTALLAASIAGAASYHIGALRAGGFDRIGNSYDSENWPDTLPIVALKSVAEDATVKQEWIEVTIKNAPDGAKTYYANMLVPVNPFRVERKTTITPLKVTAEGYQDFSMALVPEEDLTVEIEMIRLQSNKETKAEKKGRRSLFRKKSRKRAN